MICDTCSHHNSCKKICSLSGESCGKWKPSIKSIKKYKALKQNDTVYITVCNFSKRKISVYECKVISSDTSYNPNKFIITVTGALGRLNLFENQLNILDTDLTSAIINATSNNTELIDVDGISHKINYKEANEYDM